MADDPSSFSTNEILIDIVRLLSDIAHKQKDLNSSDHRNIERIKDKYD